MAENQLGFSAATEGLYTVLYSEKKAENYPLKANLEWRTSDDLDVMRTKQIRKAQKLLLSGCLVVYNLEVI